MLMQELIEIILHTDDALIDLIRRYGDITYVILFLIIFSETGLVIFPFLPGDGLLLSVGVIASTGALNIWILIPLLILAAFLGNSSNYFIGRFASRFLARVRNKSFHHHLEGSRQFYVKHGPLAIVVCGFSQSFVHTLRL